MQNNIKEKYSVLNIETKGSDTAKIRLTCEPWNDIMYSYGEVKLNEDGNEVAFLHFEYLVSDPEDFDIKLYTEQEQKDFEQLTGDILVDLIQGSLDYMESEDYDREDNSRESVSE
jgi:hypothetical protein